MLDKHWDGGFLPVGWHTVTVKDAELFKYNTGNPGVKFMLVSDDGANGGVSFPLAESALWKLASFIKVLGLTREQGAAYNENNINHHKRMIGKTLKIRVARVKAYNDPSKSYNEAVEWIPASEPTPLDEPAPTPEQFDNPEMEAPSGDQVPF